MRGINFIEEMYHQVIAGRKTMTRRASGLDMVNDTNIEMNSHVRSPDDWFLCKSTELKYTFIFENKHTGTHEFCAPRYKVGEVLYLKEPYIIEHLAKGVETINYTFEHNSYDEGIIFKNKLFMPASAARAFIRITGIRCERLLDISDEDCIAEGVRAKGIFGCVNYTKSIEYGMEVYGMTPKDSFISLYRFANKIKPTAEIPNLWVWVFSFQYLPDYKI